MSRFASLGAILLALNSPTFALGDGRKDVRVQVQVPSDLTLPPNAILVAYSPSNQEPLTLGALASRSYELPSAGIWTLQARGDGIWSEPREVTVPGPITLSIAAGTALRARLVANDRRQIPSSGVVRITPCNSLRFLSDVVCAVSPSAELSCAVPVGCFSFRARFTGFVPNYAWEVSARPPSVDLGALLLTPGASIAGTVSTEDGRPLDKSTLIRARLQRFGVDRRALGTGQLQDEVDTKPDRRGFFQLTDLASASYEVTASQEGYREAVASRVTVRQGLETSLLAPLVLTKPRTASIQLSPPVGPTGTSWSVRLDQLDPTGILPVETKAADELGFVEFTDLAPGKYGALIFESSSSAPFLIHEIEVSDASETFFIEVDFVSLEGLVLLGGEPLADAQIKFSGGQGPKTAEFVSAADGRFGGVLPAEGRFEVQISASREDVQRSLTGVEVRRRKGKTSAEVKIELSDGRIEGSVYDEESQAVPDALVELRPEGPGEAAIATRANRNGAFKFSGLPETIVTIRAASATGESYPEVVAVSEDSASEVRLIVRKVKSVRGRLMDRLGPVAGATVYLREFGGILSRGQEVVSAFDGSFEVSLPQDVSSVHLRIGAPGRAMYLERHALGADELRIELPSDGGTVELTYPPDVWKHVLFVHNGASEWYGPFQAWAALNQADGGLRDFAGGRLTIPRLAPGPWSICLVEPGSPAWVAVNVFGTPDKSCCVTFSSSPGSLARVDLVRRQDNEKVR